MAARLAPQTQMGHRSKKEAYSKTCDHHRKKPEDEPSCVALSLQSGHWGCKTNSWIQKSEFIQLDSAIYFFPPSKGRSSWLKTPRRPGFVCIGIGGASQRCQSFTRTSKPSSWLGPVSTAYPNKTPIVNYCKWSILVFQESICQMDMSVSETLKVKVTESRSWPSFIPSFWVKIPPLMIKWWDLLKKSMNLIINVTVRSSIWNHRKSCIRFSEGNRWGFGWWGFQCS